jgi:maleylacetoacetate isomerase
MTAPLRLYDYWRSTAAYRVRIALALKGLDYEAQPVHLVRGGGEQHGAAYRALNPAGLVPALAVGDLVITQSLAICEYLDERWPEPPLLPADPLDRAWVRSIALDLACDLHPLNNLRVQRYLRGELGADDEAVASWMRHWMAAGFGAIEQRLESRADKGPCCLGNQPGLADLCLVAQAYNADRFAYALDRHPRSKAVIEHCRALPAFRAARPEVQVDAPASAR